MSGCVYIFSKNPFPKYFYSGSKESRSCTWRTFFSRVIYIVVAVPVFLSTFHVPCARARNGIELWIHPYVPATQVVKRFGPLAEYLQEKTGNTFFVRVSRDYDEHIERVGLDKADMAYLGPMSYVQITQRYGPKPILASLQVEGKSFFRSVVFVNNDSGITNLADLEGRSFAFADQNSTMGYFLPMYLLEKAGVTLDKLSRYHNLKSHEDAALAVIGGYFDAGGVKEEVFRKYRGRGLKELATSQQMPEHLLVTRGDMDPEVIQILRDILVEMGKDREAAAIISTIKDTATGFSPVRDSDYNVYRDIFREVGPPVKAD